MCWQRERDVVMDEGFAQEDEDDKLMYPKQVYMHTHICLLVHDVKARNLFFEEVYMHLFELQISHIYTCSKHKFLYL